MRFVIFFLLLFCNIFFFYFFSDDLETRDILFFFNFVTFMLFYDKNKKFVMLDKEIFYYVPIHYFITILAIFLLNSFDNWISRLFIYIVNFVIVYLYLKKINKDSPRI
ncbi:hypothetical protein [Macrococcoides caseolyticum]|uniref:Uncharacterized protein n=1 Tax=Macrococcoides caseolyticum TaxID=69966 RepID=A0ACC9MNT0_9STAP|nr:hypothetical protein [Macrococcus caseolyticus]PKE38193.1 hypothetical protein CW675_12030 [Macrococcus caseolyticus]PKE55262.1 hypothetical protein CW682_12475 [Macrococcus caseolyticus]